MARSRREFVRRFGAGGAGVAAASHLIGYGRDEQLFAFEQGRGTLTGLPLRKPEARGQFTDMVERLAGNGLAQQPGKGLGFIERTAGQQHRELFSTDAGG